MPTYVLDSSVYNKIFLDEKDRSQAIRFIETSVIEHWQLIAPNVFLHEVMGTAQRYGVSLVTVSQLIQRQRSINLQLINRIEPYLETAMSIAGAGHTKSGYPSWFDSFYHAIAIVEGATFVTADKRHMAKTKQFDHVCLLKDFDFANSAEL